MNHAGRSRKRRHLFEPGDGPWLTAGRFTIVASVFCECGGSTCKVKMDGKKFAVAEMKGYKFSDLAEEAPFKDDKGKNINLKDTPSFRIKFKIPRATVERAGDVAQATITRTISLATKVSGPGFIGWRKPKDKDKADRYEAGSLVNNMEAPR